MDDEIQLGELAQAEPQTSIRPDQDAHFSTKVVGQTDSDDLAIFVDLYNLPQSLSVNLGYGMKLILKTTV